VPLRRLFAVTSVVFLIVLAISPAKNVLRPYRSIQRQYRELGMARAKSAKAAREYRARDVAIQQIWLKDLGDRVDRCTTCHLGVADPNMDGAKEPFGLHPATAHTPEQFERFGCTTCHGGQGLATSKGDAHGTAEDAGTPMLPAAYLEAGCGRCHWLESVAEAPILSRGRVLMERFGCYACHLVRGHEEFRSDAPPLSALPLKTGGEWLKRWLNDPRSLDPNATMPKFELTADDVEALSHFLFGRTVPEELARRVRWGQEESAGDPANGKKLFSESRCISCHTLEGKGNGTAPELSKVASNATRGWLLAFLRDPRAFDPGTRMPRYGFSEAESRDLVAYFEQDLRDFDAPPGLLEPVRVNLTLAEKGKKIFRQRGCFACHEPPAAKGAERFGPDLEGIGDKRAASLDFGKRTDLPRALPAWLEAKIESPRSFAQGLKMPSYGFAPADAQAVVTSLLSLGAETVPERYRPAPPQTGSVIPGGAVGALIDRYRCLSCHRIGDRGGDISTAPLTFEGSKVKRDWLVQYLVLSYTLRPTLEERMPVFRMPRENATTLADAIESFYVDPSIPEDPFAGRPATDADPAEGQRLYTTLGCRGCHIIGTAGGYVGPPLGDSASRLKAGWVFTWLKGPQRWKSDVRCPDYGLNDTAALRITAYLETLRAPVNAAAGAAGEGSR
jgi:cytochrome c2